MRANKSVLVGDDKVEEFYWCGEYVTYVNNKLVNNSFENTVLALTEQHDAKEQHEIKMTDNPHYRDQFRKEQRRKEIDEHGIDED